MSLGELLAWLGRTLEDLHIPYMVVGSLASTFHGEPRTTQDIDVVIDPSPAQLDQLLSGLDPSLFYVDDARRALARRDLFNLIDTTSGWKVDFIIRKERAFSELEMERRVPVELLGVELFVATAEDTVLAKLEWAVASRSERQVADAAAVLSISGAGLDWDHLWRWAEVLGVGGRLRELLRQDDEPES